MRRGSVALAAVLAGASGLTIATAQPAAAVAPNMVFHSFDDNVPWGYNGPFGQIIFDRSLDGGTVTWLAGGTVLAECTATVVPDDPVYGCWSRKQLEPGDYAITVQYSGSPAFEPTSTSGGSLRIHQQSTTITSVGPLTVDAGATTQVSATLTGNEPGANGPVVGAALTFAVAGGASCNGTTDSDGVARCNLTAPSAPANLNVSFAGDSHHLSSNAQVGLTLNSLPTTTTLTLDADVPKWGFTAAAEAFVHASATGTVEFRRNGGVICAAAVMSAGRATCGIPLALGLNSVVATYSGDATYAASTSSPRTVTGQPHATTTVVTPASFTFGSPSSVSVSLTDDDLNGPITGQTVTVALGSATCTVTTGATGQGACMITPTAAGSASLTSTYAGASTFESSSAAAGVTVAKGPSSTAVASTPTPYQAPAAITATVAGADGGTVAFTAGGTPIGGCTARPVTFVGGAWQATCSTTALAFGVHPVTADYTGTANVLPSASAPHHVQITAASAALTYSGDTAAVVGIPVAATATLRSAVTNDGLPGYTVQFSWPDGSCSATTDAGGTASCELPGALHSGPATIDATFAATGPFTSASDSAAVAVDAAPTTTELIVPASAEYGEPTELIARVTPGDGTGTVTFAADGTPVAGCTTVPLAPAAGADEASCTTADLAAGTRSIEATFNGNDDYAASTSDAASLTVEPGPTALEYTGDTTGTIDAPVTVRARLARDGTPPATGPLAGHDVVFTGVGGTCTASTDADGVAECTITPDEVADGGPLSASFAGTAEYAAAVGSAVVTVERAPTATELIAPFTADFGEPITLFATVAPTDGDGTVEFRSAPSGGTATVIAGCGAVPLALDEGEWTAECATSGLPAGATTISAAYSGGARHLPSTTTEAIRIDPAWTLVLYTGATAGTVAAPMTLSAKLTAQPGGPPFGYFFPVFPHAATTTPLAIGAVAPVAGVTLTFTRGDLTCSAVTDASGVGSCSVTPTDINQSGTLQVSFAGSERYAAAQRAAALTIAPAATTVTLTAPATVGFSFPVELLATVTPAPAGGTIEFLDHGTPIPGCTARPVGDDGTARCTAVLAPIGTHDLTARFAGTDSYVSSTSAPSVLSVAKATATLTYEGPTSATVGMPLAVTATLRVTGPDAQAAALHRSDALAAAQAAGGIAGQELTFRLGPVSCVATTDASGTATCTLTPESAAAGAALEIEYPGTAQYLPASLQVTLALGTTPTLPATGSDPTARLALAAVLLLAGVAATRLRRRPA